MTTRHLVDPELLGVLESFSPFALARETIVEFRADFDNMIPETPSSPDVSEREMWIDGPAGAGALRLFIAEPANATGLRPVLYHVHGGGYVMGTPDMQRPWFQMLVKELGITVISVDYRLAPETPHPGPVEDCYAGLKWAFDNADALGINPQRIAIGGESAGGGLCASLALLARDRGEVPLRLQMLICPMLDDRTCVDPDVNPYVGEFIWTAEGNRFGWECLLGHEAGRADVSPYAAAARATDLAGLPPTYIDTSALDLFLDEDIAYAQRLMRAGVPVELHVFPGAFHGFQMDPTAHVTKEQRRLSHTALRRALFD